MLEKTTTNALYNQVDFEILFKEKRSKHDDKQYIEQLTD